MAGGALTPAGKVYRAGVRTRKGFRTLADHGGGNPNHEISRKGIPTKKVFHDPPFLCRKPELDAGKILRDSDNLFKVP